MIKEEIAHQLKEVVQAFDKLNNVHTNNLLKEVRSLTAKMRFNQELSNDRLRSNEALISLINMINSISSKNRRQLKIIKKSYPSLFETDSNNDNSFDLEVVEEPKSAIVEIEAEQLSLNHEDVIEIVNTINGDNNGNTT